MASGFWGDNAGVSQADAPVYEITKLVQIITDLTIQARAKITTIHERGENISISDMFDMQMDMNHLAQMSEMSTSIVNATNTAIMSMARNIKG